MTNEPRFYVSAQYGEAKSLFYIIDRENPDPHAAIMNPDSPFTKRSHADS